MFCLFSSALSSGSRLIHKLLERSVCLSPKIDITLQKLMPNHRPYQLKQKQGSGRAEYQKPKNQNHHAGA